MKIQSKLLILPTLFFLISCGGSATKETTPEKKLPGKMTEPKTVAEAEAMFTNYNGIGPISAFELPSKIDTTIAATGKSIYEAKCTACHKVDTKFIGPSPKGILDRRTPSWVMNMILNPEEMLEKDPIAKLLYVEYNMSPMANQNLTKEEARAVLEYFRTLK